MNRVGIVVVSHSRQLACGAVEFALEMVPGQPAPVVVAAGTTDGGTGTDPMCVAEAITKAGAEGGGVLIITDLGSAVLSAEMALDLVPDPGFPVELSAGPFVEGLLAAVVTASGGASLADVEHEALGALSPKQHHLGVAPMAAMPAGPPPADAAHIDVTIVNRDGVHARPSGLIMAAISEHDASVTAQNLTQGTAAQPVTGPTALLTVGGAQGEVLRISASGPGSDAVLTAVGQLFADGFGEEREPATARDVPAPRADTATPMGVSPGRVSGTVQRMPEPIEEPPAGPRLSEPDRVTAVEALAAATTAVADDLRHRAVHAGAESRGILDATAQMATDPGIAADARRAIAEHGVPAARAVWDAYADRITGLRARGGRTAERAADLNDVRARIVAQLTGRPAPGVPDADDPYILLARDLAPADTALLDPDRCLALVTEEGGPTSHTAILARAMGIPAVVAARGAWSAPAGTVLLVDGTSGELIWDPGPEQRVDGAVQATAFDGHGATADGWSVALRANIGSDDDARAAAAANAEGIGLFRTEICFLDRDDEPSIAEQTMAYRAVFSRFPGKPVTIRTLDAGSDKPLGFVRMDHETNPSLGVRGYRTAADHPDILDRQLEAIARAARAEPAEVAVMAPMISTVDEAVAFTALARSHGLAKVGVMIETPAAALLADRLLSEVDFVSIGTNDLTQYTMAADRQLGRLAPLNDPWQPALLDLVSRVAAAGITHETPVTVCGEAASDPALAAVLVGLGVSGLSMTAAALGTVGHALAGITRDRCRETADAAVSAVNAAQARAAVRAALESVG